MAPAGVAMTGLALPGCGFALPPKHKPHPAFASDPAAVRLADAPALLVRCAIRTASLWAAAQDKLPAAVCGCAVTARALQARVYGASANPW